MCAGRVSKSFRELLRKFNTLHTTVKKILEEKGCKRPSRKVKKSHRETGAVAKARLKKLVQNVFFFFYKSTVQCVMDDETYFTMDGNEWQRKYYFDYPRGPVDPKNIFIKKKSFRRKFCCGWQ